MEEQLTSLQQGSQSLLGVQIGIDECLQKIGNNPLDFRISNNRTDLANPEKKGENVFSQKPLNIENNQCPSPQNNFLPA